MATYSDGEKAGYHLGKAVKSLEKAYGNMPRNAKQSYQNGKKSSKRK